MTKPARLSPSAHAPSSEHSASRLPLIAGIVAVGTSLALVILKTWAWLASDSAAVLASVIDSALDILISVSTVGAIWYASKPADEDHRHGHGKAEGVAALFQSAFIFGSSLFVLLQAMRFITDGDDITHHDMTITIMITAITANLALVAFQAYVRRQSGSLAIEADQAHYTSDIAIHLGVILSLYIDKMTGWRFIDPLCALLVCSWLIYNARAIGIKALHMLLDRELEDEQRSRIIDIIRNFEGIKGAHDLRTRRSGSQIKMELDIEVPPDMKLRQAHDIAIDLEHRILQDFPDSEIMIHIDPYGEPEDVRHQELDDSQKIS